jgi:hypothetical protein
MPGEGDAVKIAFVALPNDSDSYITPPLPIGYLAALLEQQRHIVRIYDLALHDPCALAEALAPLRAFRPHIVVIAATAPADVAPIEAALAGIPASIMMLGLNMRSATPGHAVAQALWSIDRPPDTSDEQSVIFEALLGLDDDLDALPFPARHLLPLEQYPLFTPVGDLQTSILIGQQFGPDSFVPRNPALIVAEMRSVAREYGIRHFVFTGPPLSADLAWQRDVLRQLVLADLGVSWEGSVEYDRITPELLRMYRRAGCEVLCFPLDGTAVLGAKDARATLAQVVELVHEHAIAVRAQIDLNSAQAAMPVLVDLAATVGLDDVRFSVPPAPPGVQRDANTSVPLENITEMVQSRYRSSLSRQFFIERFGPHMGPMLWRVGRAGLLGRTWQRRAAGGDEPGQPLPRGAGA